MGRPIQAGVYLGYRGGHRFYRDFNSLRSVSKGTAYEYFIGDVEVMMAFEYYLTNDPVLAPAVASWIPAFAGMTEGCRSVRHGKIVEGS